MSFADVLDATLRDMTGETVQSQPTVPTASVFLPYVPMDVPFAFRRPAYQTAGRAAGLQPTAGEERARMALESTRPTTTDFTLTELRSAFRRLAHAYHPDRHPEATGLEAAQLARTFATVEANYRRLSVLANRD